MDSTTSPPSVHVPHPDRSRTPEPSSPLSNTVQSTPRPDLRLVISTPVPPESHSARDSPETIDSPSPSSPSSVGSLLTPSDTFVPPFYPTSTSFHVPLKPLTSVTSASSHDCTPGSSQSFQSPASLPFPVVQKRSLADSSWPPSPRSPHASVSGPDPKYRFPPVGTASPGPTRTSYRSAHPAVGPAATIAAGGRVSISHPYARLHARNSHDGGTSKRRRMWNHALEKSMFTPQELSAIRAPDRRTIYTASMESHVDSLHAQLLENALYPIPLEKLDPYYGLNSKTAKSMVGGLQKDINDMKLKHLELQRANQTLRSCIAAHERLHGPGRSVGQSRAVLAPSTSHAGKMVAQATPPRRHSLGATAGYPYTNMFGGRP